MIVICTFKQKSLLLASGAALLLRVCVSIVVRQRNESSAADLAAAAITITAAREKVVNFIRPFQHAGLSVIVRRPDIAFNVPYSFGIFQPLDTVVWVLILLAMTVVSTPLLSLIFSLLQTEPWVQAAIPTTAVPAIFSLHRVTSRVTSKF